MLGGGKGGHEEEEKEESDRGEEVRGGRRRLEEVDDESDGIVVAFMIDDASAAGKPLRAPAADAAAARRAASSTAPRLIEAIPSFGKDTEVSRREVSEEEDERGRLQSKLFLKNSDLLCVFFFFFFFFFFFIIFPFFVSLSLIFLLQLCVSQNKNVQFPPFVYMYEAPAFLFSRLSSRCVCFCFFCFGGEKKRNKIIDSKKKKLVSFLLPPLSSLVLLLGRHRVPQPLDPAQRLPRGQLPEVRPHRAQHELEPRLGRGRQEQRGGDGDVEVERTGGGERKKLAAAVEGAAADRSSAARGSRP